MVEARWLYPRLPRPVAEKLAARLGRVSPEDRLVLASEFHPKAAPAPTGGMPIAKAQLADLARQVRIDLGPALNRPIAHGQQAAVDATLGRTLFTHMGIIPSDAANEGVWSFVALVLLPDVAAWRFPDCHVARLVGTPRNVFRRTWWRRRVLRDLVDPDKYSSPLGEDELVGIFERSRMSRSHQLARSMAKCILGLEVRDRSEFSRELSKRLRRTLAYISVDALSEAEVDRLVMEAADSALQARVDAPG